MILLLACSGPEPTPTDSLVDDSQALDSAPDSAGDSTADTGPTLGLGDVVMRATHNSYELAALSDQLDAGIRGIELDLHDDDFATHGYRVGHLFPGDGVEGEDRLAAFLEDLDGWNQAHPEASPIVLTLDLKDDLTDNGSAAAGDLAALGELLVATFGDRLGTETHDLEALRGRVLVVYSGHEETRLAMLRDAGANPAIAANDTHVVEVHDSGYGALWYWVGAREGEGVAWTRHGSMGIGWDPAVAITDEGEILVVSTSTGNVLDHRVGRIEGPDIEWSGGTTFDTGVRPSLAWTGEGFHEVHESPTTGKRWFWDLSIEEGAVVLGDHAETDDARYDEDTAGDLEVTSTPLRVNGELIRYPRVGFIELQLGNDEWIEDQAVFAAIGSGNSTQVTTWREQGRVVREWGFDESDAAESAIPHLPATDTPDAAWYEAWCLAQPNLVE